MSGPPYPRLHAGQNAIGSFAIGISQIGSIPSFDIWETIISQYANSDILTSLIVDFASYIDQTKNIDNFFDLVWNVDTAQGYGLDVWGRIVGVTRVLEVSTGQFLGFEGPAGASGAEWNVAPWYAGSPLSSNYYLSDYAYRNLILAKALANISDGSIAAINQLLINLFPNRGNCYVVDDGNMHLTYTFLFKLSAVEKAVIAQSGVLMRPAGVLATYQEIY